MRILGTLFILLMIIAILTKRSGVRVKPKTNTPRPNVEPAPQKPINHGK
jgi:hypothetical protein